MNLQHFMELSCIIIMSSAVNASAGEKGLKVKINIYLQKHGISVINVKERGTRDMVIYGLNFIDFVTSLYESPSISS